MSRRHMALLGAGASLLLAAPAQAQHQGHMMPGMTMPMPKKPAAKKPAVKKPAKKKATVRKAAPKAPALRKPAPEKAAPAKPAVKRPAKKAADPHAGHAMPQKPSTPATAADPHAGHAMPPVPHTPAAVADPHAGHDMGATGAPAGTDLPAGDSPPPPIPTDRAADAIFGKAAMDMGQHHLDLHHGAQRFTMVMIDKAEAQLRKGRDGFEWDAEAWYGGDIHRLWVKTEGEGEFGRALEKAEVQTLYSRAIGPYFNFQGGLRYDFRPDPSRAYATIAVEGMAPRFFEVEGALFLSHKGELMARVEGEYDQRITQRLIVQPSVELDFAAQNSRSIGVGAGLSEAEVGLRLRYDIRREFAPYVGVEASRAFGRTRDYRRAAGEDAGGWSLLTGVRFWF